MTQSAESNQQLSTPAGGSISSNPSDQTFHIHLHDKFDDVFARITKGRHDLKRLKLYFDERAEAERAYAAKLTKTAQIPDIADSSSLIPCFRDIRDSAANTAKQHDQFAVMCCEISLTLNRIIVDVKAIKTISVNQYKRISDDQRNKLKHLDKCREQYAEAVKNGEQALMNRDAGRASQLPEKQQVKLEQKVEKALKDVEVAHVNYQKSVDSLRESQAAYDTTIVELLKELEMTERNRLGATFELIRRFATNHDFLKSNVEQIALFLHKSCDAVNIPADIQQFIKANATGQPVRPHVEYIPIKSTIIDQATGIKTHAAMSTSVMNTQHTSNFTATTITAQSNTKQTSQPASPPPLNNVKSPGTAAVSLGTCIALYDFDSSEPGDLPFKAGDIIKLLSTEDGDWWTGEMKGVTGIFPATYVQRQDNKTAIITQPASPAKTSASTTAAQFSSPAKTNTTTTAAATTAINATTTAASTATSVNSTAAQSSGNTTAAVAPAEAPRLMDAKCTALFDFEGQDSDELSFKAGQTLIITGELNNWYLGKCEGSTKMGIFPSNYVSLIQ